MCPGSSFQWFMGIIGGSTRANRPNRRCMGWRLLGATCGIIEKKTWVGAISVWVIDRDNTVHENEVKLMGSYFFYGVNLYFIYFLSGMNGKSLLN